MDSPHPAALDVTPVLLDWSSGDRSALERLTLLVYADLHRLARRNLARERDGHLLQPPGLVNETFLHLLSARRGHGIAAHSFWRLPRA